MYYSCVQSPIGSLIPRQAPIARILAMYRLNGCSAKPLLGHHALVSVVGFRVAGFMLSGSGIRVFVHGNVELGWGGWGKVQFNVGGGVSPPPPPMKPKRSDLAQSRTSCHLVRYLLSHPRESAVLNEEP